MNSFDEKAKNWDKNDIHIARSKVISERIRESVKITTDMNGFEYGSGTGLLSFYLIEFFKSITLADSSTGMLEVLNKKIKNTNIKNMKSILLDLENENIPEEKFDVIFSQMAMHHVINPELVLKKFHSMLTKNGYLCIADLFKEDGSFHESDFTGHKGFDPELFKLDMENIGFSFVKYEECFNIKKVIEGKEKNYPVFLIIGRK